MTVQDQCFAGNKAMACATHAWWTEQSAALHQRPTDVGRHMRVEEAEAETHQPIAVYEEEVSMDSSCSSAVYKTPWVHRCTRRSRSRHCCQLRCLPQTMAPTEEQEQRRPAAGAQCTQGLCVCLPAACWCPAKCTGPENLLRARTKPVHCCSAGSRSAISEQEPPKLLRPAVPRYSVHSHRSKFGNRKAPQASAAPACVSSRGAQTCSCRRAAVSRAQKAAGRPRIPSCKAAQCCRIM